MTKQKRQFIVYNRVATPPDKQDAKKQLQAIMTRMIAAEFKKAKQHV